MIKVLPARAPGHVPVALPLGGLRRCCTVCGSAAVLALALLSPGCTLTPAGTKDERSRAEEAGTPYEPRFEERALPELPAAPTWRDVLHRCLVANGDLEAAYYDWRAAVERIDIASAYPNSNATVGFSYALSSDRMKTFDRMTFAIGFDSMENLAFPSKVKRQGRIALDQARAAGERFRAAKFDLQRRVLSGWAEYTLAAERLQVQQEQVDLARLAFEGASASVTAGGAQQDLLRSELELRKADEAVRLTQAQLAGQRALLNAMLGRLPEEPLSAAAEGPHRLVVASDADLLAAGVEQNPELAGLARQTEGRVDALELARLQWIPDINPSVVFTGDVLQAIGAAVVLPTTIAEIRGGIRESQAMLRGSEAALRQARSDRAGAFVATLILMRNAERQAAFFQVTVEPLAESLRQTSGELYSAGGGSFRDLIEARGMLLDARLAAAEARAMQETKLAELEALMGVDVETLGHCDAAVSAGMTENTNDH